MTKILLTGFEPFAGETTNASQLAVEALNLEGVQKAILPVVFDEGFAALEAAACRTPGLRYVVSVGQARGRKKISIEKVAVNFRHAPDLADNRGHFFENGSCDPSGPAAYLGPAFLSDLVQAVSAENVPCELSLSAGSFVCNDVYYLSRHRLAILGTEPLFVHVPAVEDMPTTDVVRALSRICRELLTRH
jgi:pyroglutamyl-peptidase